MFLWLLLCKCSLLIYSYSNSLVIVRDVNCASASITLVSLNAESNAASTLVNSYIFNPLYICSCSNFSTLNNLVDNIVRCVARTISRSEKTRMNIFAP